ncbi:FAD-dependent oxidoreductase domain-containing protein 2, partial [Nematolebias whitei]|uniref:FAD-dependent oxidoreductase domain-containing protein 2 n=1 Tax=Nematolebias whitei TaxID=451745 RepID=UPI0018996112
LFGSVVTSSIDHNGTQRYTYCVLGAGPAGLQMGFFLSKARRDYIILERNSGLGSFFNKYPRHRKLISINKIHTGRQNREFNLRHDWNSLLSDKPDLLFRRVSEEFYPPADAFPLYLSMFVKELDLRVRYGVDIGRIRSVQSASGRSYILTDQHSSEYTCSVLLVATGLWVPQKVEFIGSDLVEGYESISTNPEDYRDQAVLILGKGNSAFETAQSILGSASLVHMLSSSPVRLAWQTHYVGDLRALNNDLIDTYQLKSLDGLVEARLEKIVIAERKEQGRRRSGGKEEKKRKLYLTFKKYTLNRNDRNDSDVTREELPGYHIDNFPMRKPYDRVIRCLGFRFNFSIFDSTTDRPGMVTRAIHRVLERRYHGNLWPSTKLLTTQLLSWILRRVGEASGPYQMFEVLGDVVLLRGSRCEYIEEFLLQALPDFSSLSGHEVSSHGLIVLVMQYGKKKIDNLGPGRAETDWTKAWKSNFLHPVLYYYKTLPTEEQMKKRPRGWPLPRPDAIHHIVEDFLTEWDGPLSHIQPLRHFLEHCVHTDLRAFYAESCFHSALTHRKPPLFCQQGYLNQRGVPRSSQLPERAHRAGLSPAEQDAAGAPAANAAFPHYLAPAGAAVSSGLKLDF